MYTYLKFGLPRVFPPNVGSQRSHHRHGPGKGYVNNGYRDSSGPAAGSSGYDSSDNETTRGRPTNSKIRKFRSESDFRAIGAHPRATSHLHAANNIPMTALRQANSRASIAGTHYQHHAGGGGGAVGTNAGHRSGKHYGNRSHSEADLLAGAMDHHDTIGREYQHRLQSNLLHEAPMSTLAPSRRQSAVAMSLIYPNIQVHCLDVDPAVKGVSLQAKAGDLFAVMATSSREGTALLETLAGLKERRGGEILVNGQRISRHGLRNLCSFVAAADRCALDPRMSVQSTLNFYASLSGPSDAVSVKQQINILVEDLGLTAVRTSNISRLTQSEKQRLCVACQLLTQATFLILDQTTANMDIFDTFFLVEYLRQWCSNGKIVIMTLQPPTFEILSMCSGVLLLSGTRTIFSGNRSDLPRHMGSLGYPCPPFKNPADYYREFSLTSRR